MRQGDLFRICNIFVAIFFVLLFAHPSQALWLEVSGQSYPAAAPLVINLDGLKPPPRDIRNGFFAMPPTAFNVGEPRLKLQYRAEFPRSVTVETSGALAGEHVTASGALSVMTRIVFADSWWSPQLSANFADLNIEEVARGRLAAGDSIVRTEWKVRF